jgi:hypothetical protein
MLNIYIFITRENVAYSRYFSVTVPLTYCGSGKWGNFSHINRMVLSDLRSHLEYKPCEYASVTVLNCSMLELFTGFMLIFSEQANSYCIHHFQP